jgi:hypothetical protein
MEKRSPLYTNEAAVLRSRLKEANTSYPITVFEDVAGNFAVADGNHRAFVAEQQGIMIEQTIIGTLHTDVTTDPSFRQVSSLYVIEE